MDLNTLKDIASKFPCFNQGNFVLPYHQDEMIFYGGSFNPLHDGHLACIQGLNQPEKLVIVPDYNPQKELHLNVSPLETYLELEAKTKGHCFGIYPGFLLEAKKNPTYFWIKNLKDNNPNLKLSLLVGADSFLNFTSWIEFQKLLNLLHSLYVVPRLVENEKMEEQKLHLQKFAPKLEIKILAHHNFENISSSEIRSKNSLQKK